MCSSDLMEEVTDRIAAGETAAQIVEKAKAEGTGYKASVEQMYYGNQQFLFVYEQFDDVRLVAAPPSSIGKFGGDPDNWIWPRHTGDFSMFRVYASKDNRPAAYSPQNVPYRPTKPASRPRMWCNPPAKVLNRFKASLNCSCRSSSMRFLRQSPCSWPLRRLTCPPLPSCWSARRSSSS